MAVIHIDGTTVEVDSADNLLQACLSLGIDVPYFCYQPALGSVGFVLSVCGQTVSKQRRHGSWSWSSRDVMYGCPW